MNSERRLLPFSFLVSWVLHGALLLILWGSFWVAADAPPRAVVELIDAVEPGPRTAAPPSQPAPPRRQPALPAPRTRPAPPPSVPVAPAAGMPRQDIGEVGAESERPPAGREVSAVVEGEPHAAAGTAAGAQGGELVTPRVSRQILPRYPESARLAHAQGTTVIKARVLPDGAVGEILIDKSAGHAELDAAAVEAVKLWRFEPARRGSEPVPVWILIPVRFTLG